MGVDRLIAGLKKDYDTAADAVDQLYNSGEYDLYPLTGTSNHANTLMALGLVYAKPNPMTPRFISIGTERRESNFDTLARALDKARLTHDVGHLRIEADEGDHLAKDKRIGVLAAVELVQTGNSDQKIRIYAPKFYRLMVEDFTHEFSRDLSICILRERLFRFKNWYL